MNKRKMGAVPKSICFAFSKPSHYLGSLPPIKMEMGANGKKLGVKKWDKFFRFKLSLLHLLRFMIRLLNSEMKGERFQFTVIGFQKSQLQFWNRIRPSRIHDPAQIKS